MSVLTILWSAAAAACLTLAVLQFSVWLRRRDSLASLIFAFAALGAAGNAIFELAMLHATEIPTYDTAIRYSHIPIFVLLVSLVWFVAVYFQTAQRWLAWVITFSWTAGLIINFVSPHSLVYREILALRRVSLPWGEQFTLAEAVLNPWRIVADLTSLLILVYFVDASLRLIRKGDRRRALVIGGSAVFFIILGGIHTPLVDAGTIRMPYILTFAFLAIIIAMSMELIRDVLHASVLSQEVASSERRWRSLVDNVKLLVIGLDKQGLVNYVNPFALQLLGYSSDEILGKEWISNFVPDEQRKEVEKALQNLIESNSHHHHISPVLTKQGNTRQVAWSNVQIRDRFDNISGGIGIGQDITEARQDREALEKSYNEVQELKARLQEENIYLQEEIILDHNYKNIIGKSDVLKYALARVEQVAPTDMTVLIEGETGVGKELFARAIHQASPRRERPLVKINCAAIPANLLESELFGHQKGAFTGADKVRRGRFDLADGATLFLDEIGELPLDLQPKLLHVLEEGEFQAIGSNKTRKVDVRIIAATNRVLKTEIAEGRFREDLYFRISAFPISIPPLRDRRDDIPPMVEFFVDKYSRKTGKHIEKIPSQVLNSLKGYSWPGNVRELSNIIERAVMATQGNSLIIAEDLLLADPGIIGESDTQRLSLQDMERNHILDTLKSCGWRIEGSSGAAIILDIHPNTLRNRMRKLGISRPV
jgi:PAS domain S-box-containing protein